MEIQQRVHLHGGLASSEPGPWKQGQAQIDGRRIQRVKTVIQFDSHRVLCMQRSCHSDQNLREIGVDAPVAAFVRVGQCGPRHLAPEARMVALASQRTQARLDVAKALPIGQLGEGHRQKLFPAGEALVPVVAPIARNALPELVSWDVVQHLREDGLAGVHSALVSRSGPGSRRKPSASDSNR